MDGVTGGSAPEAIAIVGMAGRFPAAPDTRALWNLLSGGREATRWLTDEELLAAGESAAALQDPHYVRAAMILPDMEMFDAGFFGFTPREAAILDPQHRHFLECCWEALEDAGHAPRAFKGAIGVFGGCGMQAYMAHNLLTNRDLVEQVGMFLLRHTGNDKDFLTSRVSYLLDLKGPSIGVQTACSTSLVATHIACQSLLSGECDMALAGGVSIDLPHRRGYRHAEGEILSSNGKCRAFDDDADGTLFGSGAAVVVLRRLSDAVAQGNHIYAVIRGSAVNNDGAGKAGYLAPSVEGQARAAAEALAVAEFGPETIDYIEAHGTGTLVGDPIELAALAQAYRGAAPGAIGIGSVKTNIGHLDTAAGVASLLKVALAMRHGMLPASLNFARPNTRFDFANGPFKVAAEARAWKRGTRPRRAGVNSLGVGGTNAHLLIEEPPPRPASPPATTPQIVALSARTPAALDGLVRKWSDFLAGGEEPFHLGDAAYTTQIGRQHFAHRLAITARDQVSLAQALAGANDRRRARGKAEERAPRVVMMFPGGGAQHPGACRDLYDRQDAFRAAADACFAVIGAARTAVLRPLMFGDVADLRVASAALERPLHSILAVFIVEYALGMQWRAWGVEPEAVIGHSAGEYAAAALTGVMSLEDAIATVTLRGEIFERVPAGAMVVLKTAEARAHVLAAEFALDVAVVNAPELIVISGATAAVDALSAAATAQGIECSRVRINVAAHSRMLDAELPLFRRHVQSIRLQEPTTQFVSNLSGAYAAAGELTDPEYWVRHLREAVRFAGGLGVVLATPGAILLEAGPGQGLSALARLADGAHEPLAVIPSARLHNEAADDEEVALTAAGALWANGFPLAFRKLRGAGARQRASLPTYAFEKQRHWIEPGTSQAADEAPETGIVRLPELRDWFQAVTWTAAPLNRDARSATGTWLVFGEDAGMVPAGAPCILVRPGAEFAADDAGGYVIDPGDPTAHEALLNALDARGFRPNRIVHALALCGAAPFDSLFLMLQALQRQGWDDGIRITALTRGAFPLQGAPAAHPEHAALLGPCRVLARETPGLFAQLLDLGEDDDAAAALLAEAEAHTADTLVAWREGVRHVQALQPAAPPSATRLRPMGTYIITGGLGGIGLMLAAHLARSVQARLVLVGRSPVAELSAERMRAVHGLEAAGAEVLLLQADMTDPAQVDAAVAAAELRFGTVHGVFHAAGIVDDGLMATKGLASARAVIAAKADGAIALDRRLPDGTLDIFAVFSSTSVQVAPPGQADYVAANAVVESVAGNRQDGLVIAWGIWGEIGMAARLAAEPLGEPAHPLLGARMADGDVVRFLARLDPARDWLLLEHQVGGRAILPGMAYIELLRAAAQAVFGQERVTLQDIAFLSPLAFAAGRVRMLRTTVTPLDGGDHRIEVESRTAVAEAWVPHCEARLLRRQPKAGAAQRAAAPLPLLVTEERLLLADRGVSFGPRWRVLDSAATGAGCAEGRLTLPPDYQNDLKQFPAHPALLDVAASVGLFLQDDVGHDGTVYAPVSIARVDILAPLTPRIHAIAQRIGGQEARFEVTLFSDKGRPLMEYSGLEFRRVPIGIVTEAADRVPDIRADATVFERMLAAGIRPDEAPALFERVLASRGTLVVSSIPLARLKALFRAPPRQAGVTAPRIADPGIFANATEARIAGLCCEILGVESMRPQDEFLSFGGGSLTGVRLFARIRKEMGVELSLSALFQAPTLRELAALVVRNGGGIVEPGARPSAPPAAPPAWSPLVRIRAGAAGERPLFCIHGAGGNVVVFKPIADRLPPGTPLYGLQAQGIDGKQPFQTTIEAMAESYLAAIESVDAEGPYRIAGYSGGGTVAYEIACRIVASGRKVELLTMFDTLAPDFARATIGLGEKLRLLPRMDPGFLRQLPRRRLEQFIHARRLKRASEGDSAAATSFEVLGATAWNAFFEAQRLYHPPRYAGDILLFTATQAAASYVRSGKWLGWDALVDGSIEVVRTPARHETIFEPPSIDVVMREVCARLVALDAVLVAGITEPIT
jgi:acyl transferase domain-containing protein